MKQLGDLRVRLYQMTERIVSRLKDRSRFPLNPAVYHPDGVAINARPDIPFLQFALEGLETYHASLGRVDYPDQYPVYGSEPLVSLAKRKTGQPELPQIAISVRHDLLEFYQGLLTHLCQPGEDPDTYGETAYVDADLLQLLNERIHPGRCVAPAKADSDGTLLSLVGDPERLAARLKDGGREEALIRAVRATAARYELEGEVAERLFLWVMAQTLAVEVEYLRQLQSTTGSYQSAKGGQ